MEAYPQAIGTIQATGSAIVVANVPDVTIAAFLISAEELAAFVGVPLPIIGPPLGIEEGDSVTGYGLELVPKILVGEIPGPLPENVVLTAQEAIAIKTTVGAMNGFIFQLSQMMDFPVVDVFTAFNEVDQNGLQVGDVNLTTQLLGGFFSLDGVHPTNTGYAFIANLFIEKINEIYFFPPGFAPQPVDLEEVASTDPLVPKPASSDAGFHAAMTFDRVAWEQMIEVLSPERDWENQSQFNAAGGRRPITRYRTPFRLKPGPAFASPSPRLSARPDSRRTGRQ
jgi:hypothetical protein